MKVVFITLLVVAGAFARSAVQDSIFAEGPACPIADPLESPGPSAINVTLNPLFQLREGCERGDLVATGLSTFTTTLTSTPFFSLLLSRLPLPKSVLIPPTPMLKDTSMLAHSAQIPSQLATSLVPAQPSLPHPEFTPRDVDLSGSTSSETRSPLTALPSKLSISIPSPLTWEQPSPLEDPPLTGPLGAKTSRPTLTVTSLPTRTRLLTRSVLLPTTSSGNTPLPSSSSSSVVVVVVEKSHAKPTHKQFQTLSSTKNSLL